MSKKAASTGTSAKTTTPVLVVKRPRRKASTTTRRHCAAMPTSGNATRSKPGIPNLPFNEPLQPKEMVQEDEFSFLDNIIHSELPCDTMLAFQNLITHESNSDRSYLAIPLRSQMVPIKSVLDSQIYQVLRDDGKDGIVHQELQDLYRQHQLRRLESIRQKSHQSESRTAMLSSLASSATVVMTADDYIRGVWDAHDTTDFDEGNRHDITTFMALRSTQWFVEHLSCWTQRVLTFSQANQIWERHPIRPPITTLPQVLQHLQNIQVLLPFYRSHQETIYQFWLPQWGNLLKQLSTATQRFINLVQRTYREELLEKSFYQKSPVYKGIPAKLLIHFLQTRGVVEIHPRPSGNFLQLRSSHLLDQDPKHTAKRRRKTNDPDFLND